MGSGKVAWETTNTNTFEMIEDQTGIDCEIKDEQKILAQYKKELY